MNRCALLQICKNLLFEPDPRTPPGGVPSIGDSILDHFPYWRHSALCWLRVPKLSFSISTVSPLQGIEYVFFQTHPVCRIVFRVAACWLWTSPSEKKKIAPPSWSTLIHFFTYGLAAGLAAGNWLPLTCAWAGRARSLLSLVVSAGDECGVTSLLPWTPDLFVTLCNINFLMCSGQFVKGFFIFLVSQLLAWLSYFRW